MSDKAGLLKRLQRQVLAATQVQTQDNRAKLTYVAWADGLDAMLLASLVENLAQKRVYDGSLASLGGVGATCVHLSVK